MQQATEAARDESRRTGAINSALSFLNSGVTIKNVKDKNDIGKPTDVKYGRLRDSWSLGDGNSYANIFGTPQNFFNNTMVADGGGGYTANSNGERSLKAVVKYIWNGEGGNVFTRAWDITKKGWSENTPQEKEDLIGGFEVPLLKPATNLTVNQTSKIILKAGYYEVKGLKMTEYYYNYLWRNGRKAPFMTVEELLKISPKSITPDRMKGFYKYLYKDWELIFNPTTREIWHLQPIK